jgi:flagellin
MPSINTIIGTRASMQSLLRTERDMLSAMERISTGKRINHAGDDAAGAAIADRMTATIRALDMSVRNAADVMSMAQVAEGALDNASASLQRIRELSIQAATDIVNAEQKVYLQTEVNQLLDEMDRVTRDTTFNEIAVLDGTFADRRFQIGAHEREKAVISIANMRNDSLGAYQATTEGTSGEANLAKNALLGADKSAITSTVVGGDDFTLTGLLGSKSIAVAAGDTAKVIANQVNDDFDATGVSATASTQVKLEMHSSDANGQHVVSMNVYGKNSTAQAISATVTVGAAVGGSDLTDLRDQFNSFSSTTGITATLSADSTNIILVQDEGEDIVIENLDFVSVSNANTVMRATGLNFKQDTSGTASELQDASQTNDSMRIGGELTFHSSHTFSIVGNANGGLFEASAAASTLNSISTIDIKSMAGAIDSLKVVDRALDRVHMERAKFGAIMSRMNVVIDNLTNVSQNQAASRARIEDADFAMESSRLSKAQILQQSAMNMIAQASRTMQNVLVLFQG